MRRERIESGAEWESTVGYSRAVRIGNRVLVSGTTAVDDDGHPLDGDAYDQTRCALDIVETALDEAGATMADVVRTRLYVTDIDDWEAVACAHGEVFGDVRPAATMVEVSGLIDPSLAVELEVEAVVS